MDFDRNEFNHFLRGSLKHGVLQKRSNGLKSVIPRKRYFVLCEECLYWFREEKSRFVQKGEMDMVDAVLTNISDDTITLHKKSTGKDYLISGARSEIAEWADVLLAVLEPLNSQLNDRRTLSQKSQGKVMLTELGTSNPVDSSSVSRKSTGHSTQASSKQSQCSSVVGGDSVPEIMALKESDSDTWESVSLDDEYVGRPILTQENLKSHDSSFEPFTLDFTFAEVQEDIDDDQLKVRDAVDFFEHLDEEKKPVKRRRHVRKKRFFSKFGPETRNRLGSEPNFGGAEVPDNEKTTVIRCFTDLQNSLAEMLDELDNASGNLQSQTLDNLFLWERGNSLLSKEERQKNKVLISTESEPSFLRIPTDRALSVDSQSMYRYSRGSSYRAFRGGSYVPGMAKYLAPQMSWISVDSEESLTAAAFPESEELEDENPYEEVEEYIRIKLETNQSVSMIDLTTEFKHKRLPEEGFRKIFSKVRDRVETDKIISHRQPSAIKSELRLVNNNKLLQAPERTDSRIRHSTVYSQVEESWLIE